MTDTTAAVDREDPVKLYLASLRRALGSRDPFEVLRDMPAELRRGVSGLSPSELATSEGRGKWSIAQVVQHLADSELVVGFRLRITLAEDHPTLTAYDQDIWTERLHYADADVEIALDDFARLREANLRLLKRASPAERERTGLHSERGEESIDEMLSNCAGHDLIHLRQIARIRQTLPTQTLR